jgi:uncharacterized phage protein (TIGR01671 family)
MKEKKYRAWDKDENVMRSWKNLLTHRYAKPDIHHIFNDADYVMMEYIGRLDKEGKEICEGDIISGLIETFVIEYVDHLSAFCAMPVSCYKREDRLKFAKYIDNIYDWDSFGIVGNIFENKDLLD